MTQFWPHYLWAPNRAEVDPPNLKIWASDSTELFRENPDAILKAEHLLLNGSHILTGSKLKVNNVWSIRQPSRPEKINIEKFFEDGDKNEVDFRLRAEFLTTFIYNNIDGVRKISRVDVYKKCPNGSFSGYKFHSVIFPPDGEAIWKSFREITVAGDTQSYGRLWSYVVPIKNFKTIF